ncbi:MAG: hypothetical protein ACRYG7_06395 [Janthinobacterium lividum]
MPALRVPPFYSPLRGIAVEDLWHDNDACQVGQSLALVDRLAGKSRGKHCPFCRILNRAGLYGPR